ncbi:MAG TPA: hypothetical protein VGS57_06545 [Thermoanaerobaculia bacterium]|nr:hypothetical protein [Thermoanaerobaculia bacterium]
MAAAAAIGCGSGGTALPAPVESAATTASPAPAATPTPMATPQSTPLPATTPHAAPQATASPSAPEPSASPVPTPPYRNTVRWSTASEVDNFGYDVYRGTSPDGPFERITADPIPGAGTTDEPQKYSFVDDEIDPYATYYYYVEAISLAGVRERFTPVIPSKPKLVRPPGG